MGAACPARSRTSRNALAASRASAPPRPSVRHPAKKVGNTLKRHDRPLSQQEIGEVRGVDIDFSGIPELGGDFRKHARLAGPDRAEQVAPRITRSALDSFRAPGKG